MDIRVASAIANAEDHARWCEEAAMELDALFALVEERPLTRAESQRMVDLQRQHLRRSSAQTTLLVAYFDLGVWVRPKPPVVASPAPAPVAPPIAPRVGWLRRWLRRVVG